MTFKKFDVVRVHYPFTDQKRTKLRPALVLSTQSFNVAAKHSIMAMITSSRPVAWPGDSEIADLAAAGLPKPSLVRMKVFTLDHRFVEDKIGELAKADQKLVINSLAAVLLG